MSSYGVFAQYYDRLTENVNYEVRSDYISDFFISNGIKGGKMLDLACGTGEFAKIFTEKGFEVTGIDLSEDMLTVAKAKCPDSEFLKTDICSFNFNESYDCCICCLDSINHLGGIEEVKQCFSTVANTLKQGGMFIFDVNTPYKHNNILADNTFVFDEEDFFLSWDNELIEENKVNIYLDFFIYNGRNYDRFSEEFTETAYPSEELVSALSEYFEVLGVFDDLTYEEEKEDSERLYFVCKRK